MTTEEIALICSAIVGAGGLIAGAVRLFGNGLIATIKDAKDTVADNKLALNRNTDATLKFVESTVRLEVKLDQAHAAANRAADAVEDVVDEISGVHRAAEGQLETRTPPGGWPTPPGGYAIHRRPGTKGER